jgi:hypothetical protein
MFYMLSLRIKVNILSGVMLIKTNILSTSILSVAIKTNIVSAIKLSVTMLNVAAPEVQ